MERPAQPSTAQHGRLSVEIERGVLAPAERRASWGADPVPNSLPWSHPKQSASSNMRRASLLLGGYHAQSLSRGERQQVAVLKAAARHSPASREGTERKSPGQQLQPAALDPSRRQRQEGRGRRSRLASKDEGPPQPCIVEPERVVQPAVKPVVQQHQLPAAALRVGDYTWGQGMGALVGVHVQGCWRKWESKLWERQRRPGRACATRLPPAALRPVCTQLHSASCTPGRPPARPAARPPARPLAFGARRTKMFPSCGSQCTYPHLLRRGGRAGGQGGGAA